MEPIFLDGSDKKKLLKDRYSFENRFPMATTFNPRLSIGLKYIYV